MMNPIEGRAEAKKSFLWIRELGRVPYLSTLRAMRAFTDRRDGSTVDELWLVEHHGVYTLGQAGVRRHVIAPGGVPVLRTDRGGQVTFHGAGQIVAYLLLDLRRRGLGVRRVVETLEESVIAMLAGFGLEGARIPGAPGVYVAGRKIAALGLRVRNGRTYHGLSLNVEPQATAFDAINPCGFEALETTSLRDLGVQCSIAESARLLATGLAAKLDLRAQIAPAGVPGVASAVAEPAISAPW